jgi:hypothetical protein
MTILAYIIVLVISQFSWTAAIMMTVVPSILLAWLPDRVRMPMLGIVGGTAGVVLAVLVARYVFAWLAGPGSFGWGPFLAAVVPLSIPIWNDHVKYRELRGVLSDAPPRVAEAAAPDMDYRGAMPVGAVVGIMLSAVLFL